MSDFKATNDFTITKFSFYERLRYKLEALENTQHTNIKDINFSDLNLYGRINHNYETVYLDNSFLSNIDNNNYVIGPVATAFYDVLRHFKSAVDFDLISLNEKFLTDIKSHKGYEDPLLLYNNYIDDIFYTYNNIFLKPDSTKSFSDYVDNLIPYMKKLTSEFPMTFSSWLRNKRASPFISGLMINISSNPFDNDILKEQDFIKSINFNFFVDTCHSRGFYINKNNPSHLIADISSIPMKKFFSPNNQGNITDKQIIDQFYKLAYVEDMDLLTSKINEFYVKFIDSRKLITDIKISNDNKIYTRVSFRDSDFNINIINNNIYKLYTNIKNIEEDYIFGQADINKFIKNAQSIEKRFDNQRAITYINNEFRTTYPSKYGGLNHTIKRLRNLEDK